MTLLGTNRVAFKEWACIVKVLGSGEQILILRKGGIHEKGKKFDVASPEFFLFPTFEHQNPKDLKPEGAEILHKILAGRGEACLAPTLLKDDVVPIRYYCVIEENLWISDERVLKKLDPFHLWSWDCVKAKFDWGDQKGLFAVLVRIFSLPQTLVLENQKRYGGCRSWVELEEPLSTSGLAPVLSDKVFKDKAAEIQQILFQTKTVARS